MRLFDLVEQHDAEGPLADRIGQFAANIIADIAGRRADQALVSMLRAKLGHVEPDIGAFITEQQLGNALGKLGLSDTGRRSEEHTSELQSLMRISSAVFCLKKKNQREPDKHLPAHIDLEPIDYTLAET